MTNNNPFARHYMYGIANRDERSNHALALKHGLALLGPSFTAEVCGVCHGEGVSRFYEGFGCNYCVGTGLVCGDAPAFDSVRYQVLIAASRSLLLPFVVSVR